MVYWNEGDDEQAAVQWVQEFAHAVMQDPSAYGSYRNYVDATLKDWEEQYYGSHYHALQLVKAQYDPDNVFRYRQSIAPAS